MLVDWKVPSLHPHPAVQAPLKDGVHLGQCGRVRTEQGQESEGVPVRAVFPFRLAGPEHFVQASVDLTHAGSIARALPRPSDWNVSRDSIRGREQHLGR